MACNCQPLQTPQPLTRAKFYYGYQSSRGRVSFTHICIPRDMTGYLDTGVCLRRFPQDTMSLSSTGKDIKLQEPTCKVRSPSQTERGETAENVFCPSAVCEKGKGMYVIEYMMYRGLQRREDDTRYGCTQSTITVIAA